MTEPRCALDPELEQAIPRRRRWDASILRLVEPEPAQVEPVEPVMTEPVLPANVLAIEQARERVKWAATSTEHAQAEAHLRALLRGEQAANEPAALVPVPSTPTGWDVSKKVVRDAAGLVERIEETWRPGRTEGS